MRVGPFSADDAAREKAAKTRVNLKVEFEARSPGMGWLSSHLSMLFLKGD